MPLKSVINHFAVAVASLILGGFFVCHDNTALASTDPRSDLWMTNGAVYSTVVNQSTLYIGGDFSYIGPSTGGGIGLDAATAALVNGLPKVHGIVYAVVSDGADGWYIGGAFDNVGGEIRNNVAHIEISGAGYAVDADWAPDIDGANAAVLAMALSGSVLYVGGNFSTVDGQARNNIAALDSTATSAPYYTTWDPDTSDAVRTLVLSGSGTLFIGGDFTSVNNNGTPKTRRYLAEISLAADTDNDAGWDPDADGAVHTMLLSNSGTVFVGGDFTNINENATPKSRNHLAEIDTIADTDNATGWDPGASGTITAVNTMTLSPGGTTVYVGGEFSTVGNASRNNIAELNGTTGVATAWNPDADGAVLSLALSGKSPNTLFVGGDFLLINNRNRSRLAEIDLQTANAGTWARSAEDKVHALAMSDDGAVVFAGGEFVSAGGQLRNNLAAVDTGTGAATGFNPDVNGIVRTMTITSSGGTLYIGGDFTLVSAQARNYLAAISVLTTGGNLIVWNPDAGSVVRDVKLSNDGSRLYVAGDFTSFHGGADTRLHIAAIETASTAIVTPWAPDADDIVRTITLSSDGSVLYAGGDFGVIGQQARSNLAALSASSGTAVLPGWGPVSSAVYAIQLSSDESVLYAGGVNELSAFNVSDGTGDATFNSGAAVASDGTIETLVLSSDDQMIYVGGSFSLFGGQASNNIARYNLVEDPTFVTAWNPDSDAAVHDLILTDSDTNLYVAGDFTTIGSDNVRTGLAAIPMVPPDTTPTPAAGAYTTSQNVILDCTDNSGTDCAETYYTLDDSTPTVASTPYSTNNPINIPNDSTVTVKYFSVDNEGTYEAVNTATFVIDSVAPTTTASPGAGTYNLNSNPITLTCTDVGGSGCSASYYTTDGSTPTVSSTQYTGPIALASLEGTFSLKFISVDNAGNEESTVNSIDYTVDITPPTTTISHASGTYAPPQTIVLTCDDGNGSGCDEIYYTTDLTQPTDQSIKYSVTGPLTISSGTVIRAVAIDAAGNSGNEVVGIYAFTIGAGESKSGVGSINPALLLVFLAGFILRIRRGTGFV